MAYKITIEKLEVVQKPGHEYRQIANSGNPKDGGPIYDYVLCPKTEEVSQAIYQQTVADLDLWPVLVAINGKTTTLVRRAILDQMVQSDVHAGAYEAVPDDFTDPAVGSPAVPAGPVE